MRSRQIVCCFPSALADQSSKAFVITKVAFVEFCHCASREGFTARASGWGLTGAFIAESNGSAAKAQSLFITNRKKEPS